MPVYFGNLRVTEINRLERIQYRAAKLVTGALKYMRDSQNCHKAIPLTSVSQSFSQSVSHI